MTSRSLIQVELMILIGFGAFLLNAACTGPGAPPALMGPPSIDGLSQTTDATIDEGSDGTLEAQDPQSAVGPIFFSPLSAAFSGAYAVRNELFLDTDGLEANCIHDVGSATPGTTGCTATFNATLPITGTGVDANFELLAFSASPASGTPGLTENFAAQATISCGGTAQVADVASGISQQVALAVPVASAATACDVTLDMNVSQVASNGSVFATVLHGFRVTALDPAPTECTQNADCPAGAARCNPAGFCQPGLEGDPGVVAGIHCTTPGVDAFGNCSDQDGGSNARGDFECLAGYTAIGGICVGDPCATSADCPAARPICTDGGGCSATGARGDGCARLEGCESALCLGNRCNESVALGGDCSQPFTFCALGSTCFVLSGTCELPLPLGGSCAANSECQNAPPGGNSCLAGTCSLRSDLGGSCDDNDDCLPIGLSCQANVCLF